MERYFAEIQNGVVKRVIVADSLEWCVNALGGEWVETFRNHPTKNYGHKGASYVRELDTFIAKKPFPSWTLDERLKWKAPKALPNGKTIGMVEWDEASNNWVDVIK